MCWTFSREASFATRKRTEHRMKYEGWKIPQNEETLPPVEGENFFTLEPVFCYSIKKLKIV